MKTNKLFCAIFCMAALLAGMSSCKKDSGSDTPSDASLTLDKSVATVQVGQTVTITATVSPSTGVATFTSGNAAIATVTASGNVATVTGVAAGTAYITASYGGINRICAVTVQAAPAALHESLQGSDYYIVALDAISAEAIDGKIKADYRPDDDNTHLFIWENTMTANTPAGMNCYGSTETWYSLTVGTVGWSGLGHAVGQMATSSEANDPSVLNAMAEVYNNPNDYYVHIALKGNQGVTYLFRFTGTSGSANIAIGDNAFEDNGTSYTPYAKYTNDGEWNHIDIPVSELTKQGWMFSNNNTAPVNIVAILAGGTTGTNLDYDAVFFYKKAQ